MTKTFKIALDSRATGQGKTYSAIKYSIEQMLLGNPVSILTANNANKKDLELEVFEILKGEMGLNLQMLEVILSNDLNEVEKTRIATEERIAEIKRKSELYKDYDNNYTVSPKLLYKLLYRLEKLQEKEDELRAKLDSLPYFLKNIKEPKSIKKLAEIIQDILAKNHFNSYILKHKFIPEDSQLSNGKFVYYYPPKSNIPKTNTLIIDEVDKTLSIMSIESHDKSFHGIYFPTMRKFASSEEKERLCTLGFKAFNPKEKEEQKSLKKAGASTGELELAKRQGRVFYEGLQIIREKDFKTNYFVEQKILDLQHFKGLLIEDQIREEKNIYLSLDKENPTSLKLIYSRGEPVILDVQAGIDVLIRDNSLVVAMGATHNVFVDKLIARATAIVPMPYPAEVYASHISYTIDTTDKIKQGLEIVHVYHNQQTATAKAKVNNNDFKHHTYISHSALTGSNKYKEVDGFAFHFAINEVKASPCSPLRAMYLEMVGNFGVETNEDLDIWRTDYNYLSDRFYRQVKNKVIQAIGRLNRGNNEKYIYAKHNDILTIANHTVINILKQEVKC